MLLAADELQLTNLIGYLQQELIANNKSYVMDHLVELFRTSSTLRSCQKLHQYCEQAIAANPELLFNAQDFTKLKHASLKSLLKQDGIAMPEIEIWKKVITWGIANTDKLTANIDGWVKEDFQKLGNTLVMSFPLFAMSTSTQLTLPPCASIQEGLSKRVIQGDPPVSA